MSHEQKFYHDLADMPDLPTECYATIERKIRQRSRAKSALYALAASIILAIGTFRIVSHVQSQNDVLQTEVANELQIIHDYLNSSDLDEDLELYAVVEGY
jgi:precorrin isomerase